MKISLLKNIVESRVCVIAFIFYQIKHSIYEDLMTILRSLKNIIPNNVYIIANVLLFSVIHQYISLPIVNSYRL